MWLFGSGQPGNASAVFVYIYSCFLYVFQLLAVQTEVPPSVTSALLGNLVRNECLVPTDKYYISISTLGWLAFIAKSEKLWSALSGPGQEPDSLFLSGATPLCLKHLQCLKCCSHLLLSLHSHCHFPRYGNSFLNWSSCFNDPVSLSLSVSPVRALYLKQNLIELA